MQLARRVAELEAQVEALQGRLLTQEQEHANALESMQAHFDRIDSHIEEYLSQVATAAPTPVSPAVGPPAADSPAADSPAVGSPAVGAPAVGAPAVGSPAVGVFAANIGAVAAGNNAGELAGYTDTDRADGLVPPAPEEPSPPPPFQWPFPQDVRQRHAGFEPRTPPRGPGGIVPVGSELATAAHGTLPNPFRSLPRRWARPSRSDVGPSSPMERQSWRTLFGSGADVTGDVTEPTATSGMGDKAQEEGEEMEEDLV